MSTKNVIINEKQLKQMAIGNMQSVIKDLLKIGQGLAGYEIKSVSVPYTNNETESKLYIVDYYCPTKDD